MYNIDKEVVRLNKNGLTNTEIAKYLDIGISTIYRKTRKLGITPISKNTPKLSAKEYKKLYSLGLNDEQVAKISGLSQATVWNYRSKLMLPAIGLQYKIVTLSYKEEQAIIGGLLGDTYLGKSKLARNVSGSFTHTLKQKEYCLWKYKILKKFCREPYDTYQDDKRTGKKYEKTHCVIYTNPVFNKYWDKFYPNGKKIVPEDLLWKLDPLGIAIWYMDDGNKSGNYSLATNNFSYEDRLTIKKFFEEKYDIYTTLPKSKIIYIRACSREKFRKLIEPYIIDCMKYKL